MGDPLELAYKVAMFYVPFMVALCFHEFAHGWMAHKRGDDTALQMGRLTMNPLAHVDMMGTVILPLMILLMPGTPGFFFGWAKPVPFNPRNLKNVKADTFWIALAGPLSNILLAFVGTVIMFVLFHMTPGGASGTVVAIATLTKVFIQVNLFLAFFNLIPLHPLDGAKVLARFLPAELNYKLEQNEMMSGMILLVLVMTGALAIIAVPVEWTMRGLMMLATRGVV